MRVLCGTPCSYANVLTFFFTYIWCNRPTASLAVRGTARHCGNQLTRMRRDNQWLFKFSSRLSQYARHVVLLCTRNSRRVVLLDISNAFPSYYDGLGKSFFFAAGM